MSPTDDDLGGRAGGLAGMFAGSARPTYASRRVRIKRSGE
jgi:hypothetical protein